MARQQRVPRHVAHACSTPTRVREGGRSELRGVCGRIVFHRFLGLRQSKRMMRLRDVGMVRRLLMVPGVMVLRRLVMVARGVLVVLRGVSVMIGPAVMCHDDPPDSPR